MLDVPVALTLAAAIAIQTCKTFVERLSGLFQQ
jgi:hypothetical protein